MFGGKEGGEFVFFLKKLTGGAHLAIDARMIGEEGDPFIFQMGEVILCEEHVDAGHHLSGERSTKKEEKEGAHHQDRL